MKHDSLDDMDDMNEILSDSLAQLGFEELCLIILFSYRGRISKVLASRWQLLNFYLFFDSQK
jgi:hypothetical protein